MFLRVILWTLLAYFIYRFVFDFLIPLIKGYRQIKRQVRDFHEQSQQRQQANNQPSSSTNNSSSGPKPKAEDYIDFEEIK